MTEHVAVQQDSSVLDNAAWHALRGPHQQFAEVRDPLLRYDHDVSVFSAIADDDPSSWAGLADVSRAEEVHVLFRAGGMTPTAEWEVLFDGPSHQLVYPLDGVEVPNLPHHDAGTGAAVELRPLSDDDVPAMLALIALAQPGPFRPRTIELGGYVGIFHDGELVAMAGQRMRPPGYCEVSAVCTHPDVRRRGYASVVTLTVAEGILARGERPFLHLAATNVAALAVYEKIGFVRRGPASFKAVRLARATESTSALGTH
jgi:ribosomal protein S18 acetylase RimI-like enzyme